MILLLCVPVSVQMKHMCVRNYALLLSLKNTHTAPGYVVVSSENFQSDRVRRYNIYLTFHDFLTSKSIDHVDYTMHRSIHSLVRPAHSLQLSFLPRCTSSVPPMETSSGNCWHFEIYIGLSRVTELSDAEGKCEVLDLQVTPFSTEQCQL